MAWRNGNNSNNISTEIVGSNMDAELLALLRANRERRRMGGVTNSSEADPQRSEVHHGVPEELQALLLANRAKRMNRNQSSHAGIGEERIINDEQKVLRANRESNATGALMSSIPLETAPESAEEQQRSNLPEDLQRVIQENRRRRIHQQKQKQQQANGDPDVDSDDERSQLYARIKEAAKGDWGCFLRK